MYEDKIESLEK